MVRAGVMAAMVRRVAGLAWPGCAQEGALGIEVPAHLDLTRLERPSKPNHALAGPAGKGRREVDLITAPVDMPPAEFFALVRRAIAFIPRVYQLAEYPDHWQAHYVARSRIANFPDLITVQVERGGWEGEALLTIYSRSVYGHYDFKANLRRIQEWLTEIHIDAEAITRRT